jgi:hypothetical protein
MNIKRQQDNKYINKPIFSISRLVKICIDFVDKIKDNFYYLLIFLYSSSSMATGLPSAVPSGIVGPVAGALILITIFVVVLVFGVYYGIFVEGKNKKDRTSSDKPEE